MNFLQVSPGREFANTSHLYNTNKIWLVHTSPVDSLEVGIFKSGKHTLREHGAAMGFCRVELQIFSQLHL